MRGVGVGGRGLKLRVEVSVSVEQRDFILYIPEVVVDLSYMLVGNLVWIEVWTAKLKLLADDMVVFRSAWFKEASEQRVTWMPSYQDVVPYLPVLLLYYQSRCVACRLIQRLCQEQERNRILANRIRVQLVLVRESPFLLQPLE